MKRMTWNWLALALLAGCSAPAPTDVCPASYCNGHGSCREVAQLPTCSCESGYVGATCNACDVGTHAVGNDCVVDERCDERCGEHGTCVVTNGVAACQCAVGYDGPTCTACYGSFVATSDGGVDAGVTCSIPEQCTVASCAAGFTCDDSSGRIACSCAGSTCAACTPDLCGAHGTCSETRGLVTCTCDTGHQGERCGSCYPGYVSSDGGTCFAAEQCTASACSGHGQCNASTGKVQCTCDAQYGGTSCETCASGFHRNASGDCSADETCTATSCPGTASCDDTGGIVVCRCNIGYAGANCAQCYPGYHLEQGACVLDQRCLPSSCGPAACEDGSGRVVCFDRFGNPGCPAGFSGQFCEIETVTCSAGCNTGTCVRTSFNLNQCLCTDGRYGFSCPQGPTVTSITPSSVPLRGSATITLRGTGFVSGSTITVGGIAATGVSFISATEYRATAPDATSIGMKTVTLVAPNAQRGTGSLTVTPLTFEFDGGVQSFVVPAGVTSVSVQAWGGGGGAGRGPNVRGGAGGFASATVDVTPGERLVLMVGGGGSSIVGTALPDGGVPTAGAGGGLSGVFRSLADGGFNATTAVLIAGGGGGAGDLTDGTFGASGGNGGGAFGAAGALVTGGAADSQGVGASQQSGGVGGCFNGMLCGQTGLALQGGGGGVMSLGTPRQGATFGGGGGVGLATGFVSAGGGGGYFGGGGAANGGGLGGGGGSGFVTTTGARDEVLQRSTVVGVPAGVSSVGYVAPAGTGGRAQTAPVASGSSGLLLISW